METNTDTGEYIPYQDYVLGLLAIMLLFYMYKNF